MKSTIATSPSQSQRLIACGVDPKTADMKWTEFIPDEPDLSVGGVIYQWDCDYNPILDKNGNHIYDGIPAWSNSRLLELLPKEIESDDYCYIWLEIVWLFEDWNVPTVRYFTPPNRYEDEHNSWEFSDENIIEAIVQAVEWLTKDGYKLNKIEE